MKPKVKFVPWAIHHSYIGACLVFLGVMALGQTWSLELGYWLIGIGSLVFADDWIEHNITGSTPLRWFFDKILWPLFKK